ncbi:helix-turn-helix domain-containing protein [Streptomyces sp. NPDC049881]|uniref:GlxA family transcriptional regulator n=1 Tax=Streptomyces sp. NPDC049881 TaxID=3155778 RepID=UPI00341B55AD
MHTVAVLAPAGVVGFDLTLVCHTFSIARLPDGSAPYEVRVCGDTPVEVTAAGASCFVLDPPHPLGAALEADSIVVPGLSGAGRPGDHGPVIALLREAHRRGARVASVCTGAFLLAHAGLLDGAEATTHWLVTAQLAEAYPAVSVASDVLFVDNGRVLTSAGVASGFDLCLHMISVDHGAAVAARAARALVIPYRREAGMAQRIPPRGQGAEDGRPSLAPTLEWLRRNFHRALTLDEIARQAGLSVRSLHRRFRTETGTTPLRWLLWLRVDHARALLETTDLSVELVADVCGFGSAVSLRAHFRERVGCGPAEYRKLFRQDAVARSRQDHGARDPAPR